MNQEIRRIYEDENIIIVFKPQGIETAGQGDTVENSVGAMAVHRLDTNTEGLLVFAKNEIAKAELELAFKNRLVEKTYLALTFEKLNRSPITLGGYLLKDEKAARVRIYDKQVAGAKPIKTVVKYLRPVGDFHLVEIKPQTGRTHQIRAHLKSIGISIVGDTLYGNFKKNREYGYKRQCLAAIALKFNFDKKSPLFYLNDRQFTAKPSFAC